MTARIEPAGLESFWCPSCDETDVDKCDCSGHEIELGGDLYDALETLNEAKHLLKLSRSHVFRTTDKRGRLLRKLDAFIAKHGGPK